MDDIKNNILFKIKEIEDAIINTNTCNETKPLLYILENNINNILNNDIKVIKRINNSKKEKNYFEILPIEIINKILSYINIEILFKINFLNRNIKIIIDEYIKNNINYSLEFKINKTNIYKKLYMKIYCSKCNNIFNGYLKGYINNVINCNFCKIKEYNYNIYPKIKNFEIKFINNTLVDSKLINNEIINNIKEIYNLSDVYNTCLMMDGYSYSKFEDNQSFDKSFECIIKMILENTKYKIKIITPKSINKEIYIKNETLKYLSIPDRFTNLRLECKNLLEIQMYETLQLKPIDIFIEYMLIFSLKN